MHVSVGYSRRNWRCNLDVTQSLTQLHVAQTLGKLKYKEVEPKLIEMYNVQPEEVKRQIISAIADLKTDKALGFLYNAYDEADNWGTKRVILKALYEYSAMGRKTFDQLERKADSHTAILFAHTKHPLINQLN